MIFGNYSAVFAGLRQRMPAERCGSRGGRCVPHSQLAATTLAGSTPIRQLLILAPRVPPAGGGLQLRDARSDTRRLRPNPQKSILPGSSCPPRGALRLGDEAGDLAGRKSTANLFSAAASGERILRPRRPVKDAVRPLRIRGLRADRCHGDLAIRSQPKEQSPPKAKPCSLSRVRLIAAPLSLRHLLSPAGISSRFCSPQNERNPSSSGRATDFPRAGGNLVQTRLRV